jgi:serine/threonine-protein kinase
MGMQAMKVFRHDLEVDPAADRFYEAFLLSGVSHRQIVRVFDANVIEDNGQTLDYLTMELVPGGTLESFLNELPEPPGLEPALDIVSQVASGLAHAHAMEVPIVHRDVKPSNVLISGPADAPCAKLADFGLARWINPMTGVVTSAGTILYTPPEGFSGYLVPASDVYSLGLMTYQLLCDCLPFRTNDLTAESASQICRKRVQQALKKTWRPPSYFNSEISSTVDELVMTAISIDLDSRFSTAGEFLEALNEVRSGFDTDGSRGPGDVATSRTLEAHKLVSQAFELAQSPQTLSQAAISLERALEIQSQLAGQFSRYLHAWRVQLGDSQ